MLNDSLCVPNRGITDEKNKLTSQVLAGWEIIEIFHCKESMIY